MKLGKTPSALHVGGGGGNAPSMPPPTPSLREYILSQEAGMHDYWQKHD